MFAIGPGSIPWFLVSELFNQSARPAATSLAVAINWLANFMVGLGFLPLQVSVLFINLNWFITVISGKIATLRFSILRFYSE